MRIGEPGTSSTSVRDDASRVAPWQRWPLARLEPARPAAPTRPESTDGYARVPTGTGAATGARTAAPRVLDDREELRGLRRELAGRAAVAATPDMLRAGARVDDVAPRPPAAPRTREAPAAVRAGGPKPAGTAAKAGWYRALVEQSGGKWRTGVDQVNIVGLRGQGVDGGRNHNRFNQWNDTVAYVWKGQDGKMHVREFQATTDPGVTGGPGKGRDVDGNGSGDIAHLRPGSYPYRLGSHHDVYGAGNPTYNLPVDRDTNHNGSISKAERAASKRRGDVGYGINIHWGDGSVVGGWSEGCQVIKGSYDHFRQNVTPIMERNRGQMYYTLIDRTR